MGWFFFFFFTIVRRVAKQFCSFRLLNIFSIHFSCLRFYYVHFAYLSLGIKLNSEY
jgi:hypothetical protein